MKPPMPPGALPPFSLLLVGAIEARPRVNLEPRSESIRLELAETVADAFVVPCDGVYTSDLHVSSWRTSLSTAFVNGLKDSFAETQGEPDLVLRIERADVFFDDKDSGGTTVLPGEPLHIAPNIKIACNLQYRAYLLDARGTVLAKDVATARFANGRWTRRDLVIGAMSQSFEQIAQRFFGEPAAGAVTRGARWGAGLEPPAREPRGFRSPGPLG